MRERRNVPPEKKLLQNHLPGAVQLREEVLNLFHRGLPRCPGINPFRLWCKGIQSQETLEKKLSQASMLLLQILRLLFPGTQAGLALEVLDARCKAVAHLCELVLNEFNQSLFCRTFITRGRRRRGLLISPGARNRAGGAHHLDGASIPY